MCDQNIYGLLTKFRKSAAGLPRRSVSVRAVHHLYSDKEETNEDQGQEEIPP
jgi:hypothetical protein